MWDVFSTILNIILGLLTIYLYMENKRLKGFEIDRDIKLKKIEIGELAQEHQENLQNMSENMNTRGLLRSGIETKEIENLNKKNQNRIDKLGAELDYLEKRKKYRWIFSKVNKVNFN